MNTPDTEWETVDRYSVETGLLKRFFKLYEEGRKTGDPQNFIDYFKAEHYLLIEVGKAISSRDTYWKERVEEAYEAGKAHEAQECRGSVADNHPNAPYDLPEYFPWKDKFEAITNKDNLK